MAKKQTKKKENELIISVVGKVQSSNLAEFQKQIKKVIKAADKELVSDDDFLEAADNVVKFKAAEKALEVAKERALSETVDIKKLFDAVNKLQDDLRETRLKLNKKCVDEKESRKLEIVKKGVDKVQSKYSELALDTNFSSTHDFFSLNVPESMNLAVKGKKLISKMELAVEEAANKIIESMEAEAARIKSVVEKLGQDIDEEFKPLFQDVINLCMMSEEVLTAEISKRISEYKLAKAEKAAADKAEAERLTAEQEQAAPVVDIPVGSSVDQGFQSNVNSFEDAPADPNVTDHGSTYEPTQESAPLQDDFYIVTQMRCDVDTAKTIAKILRDSYSDTDAVIDTKLRQGIFTS